MPQLIKTEALVIRSMRFKDTSKIVHLFTRDFGFLKVIAKGVLRPKNPLSGTVESLNRIEAIVSVKESRSLQILTQADPINLYSNIRENLDSTAVAYAITELLQAFIPYNEKVQQLYHYTVDIFDILNRNLLSNHIFLLYHYLLFLSDYLGFGWNFTECRQCGREPEDFPLPVDVENGAIVCKQCSLGMATGKGIIHENQWNLLITLRNFSTEELPDNLNNLKTTPGIHELFDILLAHLNYHTDQTLQLKSLKMYLT